MNKKFLITLFQFLFIGGIFLLPLISSADNSDIVINEIAAYPTANHDWIEIYNKGLSVVNIFGWKFFQSNTNHSLTTTTGTDFLIEPSEYAIIADNPTNFLADHSTFSGSLFDSSFSLTNTGEQIALKTSTDPASTLESFTYLSSTKNQSLERINPAINDYTANNWQETGDTPGSQNHDFNLSTSTPTNLLPIARISLSTSTTYTNQLINFDAASSSDPENQLLNYFWDFGDGSTSSLATTSHAYTSTSSFNVFLTVTDDHNASDTTSTLISITSIPATSTESTSTTVILPHDLVINEFLSDPNTGDKEWIELYNQTSSTLDLSNLSFSDNSSTTTISGLILPSDFKVLEFSSRLNNSGDILTITNASGQIIDQVIYGDYAGSDKVPAPDKNYSVARKSDGLISGSNQNDFVETITPTKGQTNLITPKPITTSGGSTSASIKITTPTTSTTTSSSTIATSSINFSKLIIINEILPRPSDNETENEFIELKNLSTSTIDLAGWYLSDNAKRRFIIKASTSSTTTIPASGFLTIKRSQSHIVLNNSGLESVKLYDPELTLIDLVEYRGPVEANYAYARYEDGNYDWTSAPTPNTENIFPEDIVDESDDSTTETPITKTSVKKTSTAKKSTGGNFISTNLENIRDLDTNQKVIVTGIVSVVPGVLGTQIFYLSGSGIQIYCYKKDFPELKEGNKIQVSGTLVKTASSEARIKITTKQDIKVLETTAQPVMPHELKDEINLEDWEGSLVKISGQLIEIKSNSLFIDTGDQELEVYIKPSTGISKSNLVDGSQITITGIVTKSSNNYRIMPRYQSDIEVGQVLGEKITTTSSPETTSSNKLNKYYLLIILFLIAIIGWQLWPKKKPSN